MLQPSVFAASAIDFDCGLSTRTDRLRCTKLPLYYHCHFRTRSMPVTGSFTSCLSLLAALNSAVSLASLASSSATCSWTSFNLEGMKIGTIAWVILECRCSSHSYSCKRHVMPPFVEKRLRNLQAATWALPSQEVVTPLQQHSSITSCCRDTHVELASFS